MYRRRQRSRFAAVGIVRDGSNGGVTRKRSAATKLSAHKKQALELLCEMFHTQQRIMVQLLRAAGGPDNVEMALAVEYLHNAQEAAVSSLIFDSSLASATATREPTGA